MTELVRLYTQIALLRRGPQDVPAAPALLAATVGAYFLINIVVNWLLPQGAGPWLALQVVDILFTLGWYALLLRVAGKPERYLQTTSAIFGYQAVLSPLSMASGWLIRRFGEQAAWQFPLGVIFLVIVIWSVAANSHVLKAALEWSMFYCVLLVVLQIFSSELLLYSLFPAAR